MCFVLCSLEMPTPGGLVYAGGSVLGMTEATLVGSLHWMRMIAAEACLILKFAKTKAKALAL